MEKDLRTANSPTRHLEFLRNLKKFRIPTKRRAENIEEVEQKIAETPNKSIQRLAQETNLSFDTVRLILKKICTFFPIVCLLCMNLNPLTIRAPTT
jgi:hypothetical protein